MENSIIAVYFLFAQFDIAAFGGSNLIPIRQRSSDKIAACIKASTLVSERLFNSIWLV